MTYEEASNYMTATYIYAGVSMDDIYNCPQNKYFSEVNGIKLLGVEQEIPELMMKRLVPKPTEA